MIHRAVIGVLDGILWVLGLLLAVHLAATVWLLLMAILPMR